MRTLVTTSLIPVAILLLGVITQVSPAAAQAVLFDFDSAPASASLPISQTVGGITAYFSATGQGYSIQPANTMGFTPPGFAGNCIYPSSINLSDLLIRFDQTLVYFSIMYSVHELGCDTSATMRVTAYANGIYVGTDTKVAGQPGTWPADTLRCIFIQGFDSVVVHYDKRPSTCQDYGTIFMADNMWVTPLALGIASQEELPDRFALWQNYPNPFNPSTAIRYEIPGVSEVRLSVFDMLGREVMVLVNERKDAGTHDARLEGKGLASGVYLCRLHAHLMTGGQGGDFTQTRKLLLLK